MIEESSILILANNPNIDKRLGTILKKLGYTYQIANRVDLATMDLLSSNQIRCILLSLQDQEGILFVQTIYQKYRIPAIFYTPSLTEETVQTVKKIPPPIYLTTLYDKDELYVNIELVCHNHRNVMEPVLLSPQLFNKEQLSFFVKSKYSFYRINYNEVLFIKGEHVYVKICMNQNKSYLIRSSLSVLLEELPSYFCRIHRSYIVNLKNVDVIHNKSVLVGEKEIPLGKNYQKELIRLIRLSEGSCFMG